MFRETGQIFTYSLPCLRILAKCGVNETGVLCRLLMLHGGTLVVGYLAR